MLAHAASLAAANALAAQRHLAPQRFNVSDRRGEIVFEVGQAAVSHSWGPKYGRAHVLAVSPSGADLAGDVTVLVSGAAFHDFGDVRCRFCSIAVRGTVHHPGAITCVAPSYEELVQRGGTPPSIPTSCNVDVTLNGVDYTGRPKWGFWYFNRSKISLATMRPSGGGLAGGTRISLTGTSFFDYGGGVGVQGAKCRFGDNVVPATITTAQEAHCISPPTTAQPLDSDVPVWLSLNGYTDERGLAGDGVLQFRYAHPPVVSGLHPLGGPRAGGMLLTVHGTDFEDRSVASSNCTLGDDLYCEMHRIALGVTRTDDWRPGLACIFEGSGKPPLMVPASMGEEPDTLTCLTPEGGALWPLARPPGPWCARLGHTPQCADPAYAAAGVVAVEVRVTRNGDVAAASTGALTHMLYVEGSPRLDYVEPWGGPEAGGTMVSIVGEGLLAFGAQPLCRFGLRDVPATVGGLNATRALDGTSALRVRADLYDSRATKAIVVQAGRLITCEAPAGSGRNLRLSVSLTGNRDDFSRSSLIWRYTSLLLQSVSPIGGPLTGGAQLALTGTFFSSSLGGFRCVLGEHAVPASRSPPDGLVCQAPPSRTPGPVPVRVSVNGDLDDRSLSPSSADLRFFYYDDQSVVISSLSPAQGPVLGGTAVTVSGAGFAVLGAVRCQFGDQPIIRGVPQIVDAYYNETVDNSTHAVDKFVCYSPPTHLDSVAMTTKQVPVYVLLNGQPLAPGVTQAVRFNYTNLCLGRNQLGYYAATGAQEMLVSYLALNSGYSMTQEEVEMTVNGTMETPVHIEAALREYADATCFQPDENYVGRVGERGPWEHRIA